MKPSTSLPVILLASLLFGCTGKLGYEGDARTDGEPEIDWSVSNIPDPGLLLAGEDPTDGDWPGEGTYWVGFDTDDGSVTIYDAMPPDGEVVREVRPEGTGLDSGSGIHFEVVDQGTLYPELGVFSFQKLDVPDNYIYGVTGSRPLVLLSEEGARIAGGVFAGCFPSGDFAVGGAGDGGEGPGAGGDGSTHLTWGEYRHGGGGGGGYAGRGGRGACIAVDLCGDMGEPFGTEDLVPLLGGSGGGRGGGISHGRWGGRGGSAVQIASAVEVHVTAGGWVDAGGCGGSPSFDDEAPEAGGGGGSGGAILIEAPTVRVEGAVTANGGGGGAGGAGFEVPSLYGEPGQIGSSEPAAGGVAGAADACDGGSGAAGGEIDGQWGATCNDPDKNNAGGGGGGAGRIRLNGDVELEGLASPEDSTTTGELNPP
jgi:hypothetical protein